MGRLRPIALLVLLGCAAQSGANPTGPTVAAGTATFATAGGTLMITNSSGTIINWQGFSIGSGETTRFNQPGTSSTVLNRVTGGSQSSILGSLTSNGHVFLVNPNGMVFAPGSQVNVSSLTLSTTGISDANFLAGNHVFDSGSGASITLAGVIQANVITLDTGHGFGTNLVQGGTLSVGPNTVVMNSSNVVLMLRSAGATTTSTGSVNLPTSAIANAGSFGSQTGVLTLATSGQGGTTSLVAAQGTAGIALVVGNPAAASGQATLARDSSGGSNPGIAAGASAVVSSLSFNLEKRAVGF